MKSKNKKGKKKTLSPCDKFIFAVEIEIYVYFVLCEETYVYTIALRQKYMRMAKDIICVVLLLLLLLSTITI